MRTVRRLACCAALIGALAGCGGGDKATPVLPDRAGDQALAHGALLRMADFPTGWRQGSRSAVKPPSCTEIRAAQDLTSARQTGPDFSHGTFSHVENAIYLYPVEADARRAFTRLTSAESQGCYAQTLSHAFSGQAGVKVGRTRARALALERLGDDRSGRRVSVALIVKGLEVDLAVDLVVVRVGRGISIGLFFDAPQPFAEDLRGSLSSATVRRLDDELS